MGNVKIVPVDLNIEKYHVLAGENLIPSTRVIDKKDQMKTAGIIGGIAPESTIQYYRQAVAEYQRLTSENEFPSIIINSIDMTKMPNLIGQIKLDEVTNHLLLEINKSWNFRDTIYNPRYNVSKCFF